MMTPSKDLDLDLLELGGAVQWQEPNTARVQVAFFSFFLGRVVEGTNVKG